MQNTTQPKELSTRLLNTDDIAEHLGVEPRHVRRLVQERRIPFIKWGHYFRFDPAEVARWLDAYRRESDVTA